MNSFISDIRTAAGIFKDIRQERKSGKEVVFQKRIVLPCISGGGVGFYNTVEGCVLANCGKDVNDIARTAFDRLPYEEQHRLSHRIEDGTFIERAIFWKELLRPLMTPAQYRRALIGILQWYIHIKQLKAAG